MRNRIYMNKKTTSTLRPPILIRLRQVLGPESPSRRTINRRPYLGIIWPAGEHRCRNWARNIVSRLVSSSRFLLRSLQGPNIPDSGVRYLYGTCWASVAPDGGRSIACAVLFLGWILHIYLHCIIGRGQTLRLLAEKWRGGRYQCGTGGLRRLSSGLGALVGASTIRSL